MARLMLQIVLLFVVASMTFASQEGTSQRVSNIFLLQMCFENFWEPEGLWLGMLRTKTHLKQLNSPVCMVQAWVKWTRGTKKGTKCQPDHSVLKNVCQISNTLFTSTEFITQLHIEGLQGRKRLWWRRFGQHQGWIRNLSPAWRLIWQRCWRYHLRLKKGNYDNTVCNLLS